MSRSLFLAAGIVLTAGQVAAQDFQPRLGEPVREEIFELFPELRQNANAYGMAVRPSLASWEAL